MARLALYREWRPASFRDLSGQEHISRTLKNALMQGRLSHAYLFSGPRGTGKTTVARILARAVNCLNLEQGEPCGQCEPCQLISRGADTDVIEIDAASNNGVDHVRELREQVQYAPTRMRYKVYIIDEVHMLSTGAFNALLKTLEEPPAHALFILATTEIHKVPITILSRCQRFDFHRLSQTEITNRLAEICAEYEVQVEPEALQLIARQAEGGMRDALSLLDQVLAFLPNPGQLTLADAQAVLGAAAQERLEELAVALAVRDGAALLRGIDQLVSEGKELRQFLRDFVGYLRDLLLAQLGINAGLKGVAEQFSRPQLLTAIEQLAGLEAELRTSLQPRLLIEVALLKLCQGPTVVASDAVAPPEQVAPPAAETRVARPSAPAGGQAPSPSKTEAPRPAAPQGSAPPASAAAGSVEALWQELLEVVKNEKRALHAFLLEAEERRLVDKRLILGYRPRWSFHKEKVEEPDNRALIEAALARLGHPGLTVVTQFIGEGDAAPGQGQPSSLVGPGPLTAKVLEQFGGKIVDE